MSQSYFATHDLAPPALGRLLAGITSAKRCKHHARMDLTSIRVDNFLDDVTGLAWHVHSDADVAKRPRPGLSCSFFTVEEYVGIHIASGLLYYRTHGRHWALSIDKGTSASDAEKTYTHPRSSAQCWPSGNMQECSLSSDNYCGCGKGK